MQQRPASCPASSRLPIVVVPDLFLWPPPGKLADCMGSELTMGIVHESSVSLIGGLVGAMGASVTGA
jgi:hypothetical protein